MATMGTHSRPLDGTVTANGHQVVPWHTGQLQAEGRPVSVLPQPNGGEPPRTVPNGGEHWWHAVTAHRGWLAAVPIVLVNAVATGAQLGFWNAHLAAPVQAVMVALALESIAVYLAWQAHLAQLADDSALRLRLAAYGFALVIGTLNYSHFMLPGWRPTVAAVTFGLMSAVSPWLWSVHSRRASRDALKARGLIEPHAVRLGATRWMWHPYRSACVMWRATWLGETDPARAIALAQDDHPGDTSDDAADDQPDDAADDRGGDGGSDRPPPGPRRRRASQRDKVLRVMKRHPGLPDVEVAKRAGVSLSTVQRTKKVSTT